MGLICCGKCNKEFSDLLDACPYCEQKNVNEIELENVGEAEQEKESLETEGTEKTERKQITITLPSKDTFSKKTLAIIVAVMGGLILIFSGGISSPREKAALMNCEEIISRLKNPDSFKLYGDAEILVVYDAETKEKEHEFMYLDYGATNSYGGMVRSVVSFDGTNYLGDITEDLEIDDFYSNEEWLTYMDARMQRNIYSLLGNDSDTWNYELKTVSKEKLEKKLGID